MREQVEREPHVTNPSSKQATSAATAQSASPKRVALGTSGPGHLALSSREPIARSGGGRIRRGAVIQAKLRVGAADDPHEREADRVAARVVEAIWSSSAAPSSAEDSEAPAVQRATPISRVARFVDDGAGGASIGAAGGELDAATSSRIKRARGGGSPIEPGVRASMEQGFGADFSRVRVHDDPGADQLNRAMQARAFTTGSDIFFSSGTYQPRSRSGQQLLAHELTHVVQQGGAIGAAAPARRSGEVVQRFTDVEKTALLQGQYEKRAEEFEFKLGYALSKDPRALEGAKALTDKFKQLLIEHHGAGKEADAYEPKNTSTGRVTKERITEVFDSGNLRERMGTLYAAITNFNSDYGLGKMLGAAAQTPGKSDKTVDTALLAKEATAKQRPFTRKGRTGDESQNDRMRVGDPGYTQVDANKRMDAFFASKDAPTPNKVLARGEAPLTSREYEGSFPAETKKISSANKDWGTLDEAAKVLAYNTALGDTTLKNWVGGENWNKLGPKLQQEGKSKNMRMLAGFSGTSDMYFHAGQYFKLAKPALLKIRLAAIGTMIPARDHSFHEIMVASQEYGLDYTEGPVGYSKFMPLQSKELLAMTGASFFPHELLGDSAKQSFDDNTAATSQRVPVLPQRSQMPKVGWQAKYSIGLSTYELILKSLDEYHVALKANKPERNAIADTIVQRVDAWMLKNSGRNHGTDAAKINALKDLREKALGAGSVGAIAATEQSLTAKVITANLTDDTDENSPGDLAFTPQVAHGLSEEGVIALDTLLKRCKTLAALPAPPDVSVLPAVKDAAFYKSLLASPEGVVLQTAIGDNAGLLLRVFVAGHGASKICKPLAPTDPDNVAFGRLAAALDLIGSNFAGVQVRLDGIGPREGDVHKVEGGAQVQKNKRLADAFKLTPLELDCIIGYTTLEYKKFVDGTASAERLAALSSGLRKLPSFSGPVYRGDYSYQNSRDPARDFRVGAKRKVGFTSTGKSMADSFIPKRPTAHVYLESRSGADIEALSKKTWEQEVLFPDGVTFQVVAVVDKQRKVTGTRPSATDPTKKERVYEPRKATLGADGSLTGAHGMPTLAEQQRAGLSGKAALDLKINDPHVQEPTWAEHFTETFSNKAWVFWKEV